jgi:hypothetical protein
MSSLIPWSRRLGADAARLASAVNLAILLPAGSLAAQTNPDSVKHHNECRFARQVVESGHPARYLRWSLGYLAACGAGEQGAVVAQAVHALRTETDTVVLRPYWRISTHLRDRRLFEAAAEIAVDRGARTEARVFAISALFTATSLDSYADYEHLVGGFRADGGA